jgi:hypothetical protein
MDFRRRVRLAWWDVRAGRSPHTDLATDLGIPREQLRHLLSNHYFGAAWAQIELGSPFLLRRRVRFADLPRQIACARELLGQHDNRCAPPPRLNLFPDPTGDDRQCE